MAIGFMANKLGENLARYMPFLQPVLIIGLKNIEEYQVIDHMSPMHVMSSYVMCYTMLWYAMLCDITLCHIILRCVMLR